MDEVAPGRERESVCSGKEGEHVDAVGRDDADRGDEEDREPADGQAEQARRREARTQAPPPPFDGGAVPGLGGHPL